MAVPQGVCEVVRAFPPSPDQSPRRAAPPPLFHLRSRRLRSDLSDDPAEPTLPHPVLLLSATAQPARRCHTCRRPTCRRRTYRRQDPPSPFYLPPPGLPSPYLSPPSLPSPKRAELPEQHLPLTSHAASSLGDFDGAGESALLTDLLFGAEEEFTPVNNFGISEQDEILLEALVSHLEEATAVRDLKQAL